MKQNGDSKDDGVWAKPAPPRPDVRNTFETMKIALSATLLLSLLALPASSETILGTEARFSPTTGQPLFPAGNLNVFKQFELGFEVQERIGDTVEIDLLFTSIEFGGEVKAGLGAHFGLEMGLCLGGNADFDLGFQPSVTLPDRYPSEVPVPITVEEGLQPDSHFTTTFPPLGKMYADLILDLSANLSAEACVFGCFTPIDFSFSTCDIPPLQPSGISLFNESVRCDPALDARKYCAIELASFNRNDDNTARVINVAADNLAEVLAEPYLEFSPSVSQERGFSGDAFTDTVTVTGSHPFLHKTPVRVSGSSLPGGLDAARTYYVKSLSASPSPGQVFSLSQSPGGSAVNITSNGTGKIAPAEIETPDSPLSGRYGTLSLAAPTVNTDSSDSMFNTAQTLRSSGAEDVLGVGINLAQMVTDFVLPPPFPPLSDSGSIGPIDWDYTLANLDLGPAIQLQMDFEMTWDLAITEMTFRVPGTTTPKPVRLFTAPGSTFPINGTQVNKLTDIPGAAGAFLLTNAGARAMPMISLLTDLPLKPAGVPQDPVEVNITYELKPKLKTVVSVPFIGRLNYKVLSAGAEISRIGDLRFGPLVEGDHKFKLGEFEVYHGDPSTIQSAGTGSMKFTMRSAGPPSFQWNPVQWPGATDNGYLWTGIAPTNVTNWRELISVPNLTNSFPGMGGPNSDAMIKVTPGPRLTSSQTVATLSVGSGNTLAINQNGGGNATNLIVGGLVENCGTIAIGGSTTNGNTMRLNSRDAVLCGDGRVVLLSNSALTGYIGPEATSLCNYNIIQGGGPAFNQRGVNAGGATLHNMGRFSADKGVDGDRRVTLDILFDNYPGETSWDIRNAGGTIVAGHGAYTGQGAMSRVSEDLFLPDGTYTLTVNDSAGDGMCCGQFGDGSFALLNANGVVLVSGATFGAVRQGSFTVGTTGLPAAALTTSANLILNQGTFSATAEHQMNVSADRLENRTGSSMNAFGLQSYLTLECDTAEHSGLIEAINGGWVAIHPLATGTSIWNGGQSFREDCGIFRASNNGALDIGNARMSGGCFLLGEGGTMFTLASSYEAAVFEIGRLDDFLDGQESGLLSIIGGTNQVFTRTCLNNYGTLSVESDAEFMNPMLFANHGTIKIEPGSTLRIGENAIATPGASEEAKLQPGSANVTADALVGGTWDIAGTLLLDGCTLDSIGADCAPASTRSGTTNEFSLPGSAGEQQTNFFDWYDLQMLSVAVTGDLPAAGRSLLVLAKVGSVRHFRIFNSKGVKVIDKPESQLIPGFFRSELRDILNTVPFPSADSFESAERQSILERAASIAGHGPGDDTDPGRIMSAGAPAKVIMRGTGWSFPALMRLRENRGSLSVIEGANLPVNTIFTNKDELVVSPGSTMTVNGTFTQTGAQASTTITNGTFRSLTGEYVIGGGTFTADAASSVFGLVGTTVPAGTRITVTSPVLDTNEFAYTRERVVVNSPPITTIAAGAEVTLNGYELSFGALTGNLRTIAGKLAVTGEGNQNGAVLTFAISDELVNTGQIEVTGYSTELKTRRITQNGASAKTRIGAGASLIVTNQMTINGGECVVEIGSRPHLGQFGFLNVGGSVNFGDKLVIDFTEDFADPTARVDTGDTWEIMPRTTATTISGINTVAFRLNGASLPANWLPAQTHLELIRFNTPNGTRGLGVRVVPNAGQISYDNWATSTGLNPLSVLADPFRLAQVPGVVNADSFAFGVDGVRKTSPSQSQQFGLVMDGDGNRTPRFSYTRPFGTDATYDPYFSRDLKVWFRAPMVILPNPSVPTLGALETVTMQSVYPTTDPVLFYRVGAELNPDNFEIGEIPAKPLQGSMGLRNLKQNLEGSGTVINYDVAVGKALFFNVTGSTPGDQLWGGTAPDGVTRNFIYQDRSRVSQAAVHAGLLRNGERGTIIATLIPPQQTPFLGSTQSAGNGTITSSNATVDAFPYSYRVDLYEVFQ